MIDSARRAQKKEKPQDFHFSAEPPPILWKVSDYGMKRSLK